MILVIRVAPMALLATDILAMPLVVPHLRVAAVTTLPGTAESFLEAEATEGLEICLVNPPRCDNALCGIYSSFFTSFATGTLLKKL